MIAAPVPAEEEEEEMRRSWLGAFEGERGGTLRRWPPGLAAAARCHHRSLGCGGSREHQPKGDEVN